MNSSSNQPHSSRPPTPTSLTKPEQPILVDDWDKPFTNEQLAAIDAAFEAATATTPLPIKNPRSNSDTSDGHRPQARRRLPDSLAGASSARNPTSFALTPCRTYSSFRQANVKLKYPVMNFGGCIVYSRTIEEVEEATLQILNLLEARKHEMGRAVIGLDVEWKPSFDRGVSQGKAAVMQICVDMTHCYVLHIFHSGIPPSLQSLLEDSTSIKKLGGLPKQWSLSSLVETLTCKQLLKPKKIRLGNWEANPLSKPQLQYAATDAFASWYLYEVLMSFPDISESPKEN